MSEVELRRLLADAVPESRPAPDRAGAARTRARRSRNRYVAGVSVVAVAVAIGIPVALAQHSDQRTEPAPEPKGLSCPAPVTNGPLPGTVPDGGSSTLEPGATRARLCYLGGVPWQPPADELDNRVEELVSLVNEAPVSKLSGEQVCPANLGPTRTLLFGYSDGTTRLVSVAAYGCNAITVGGVTRGGWTDADALVNRFVELLRAQRGDSEPAEAIKTSLSCGSSSISVFGNDPPPALTNAILCVRHRTNSDQPVGTARISAEDLRVLMADMAAHRTTRSQVDHRSCPLQSVDLRIIGSNAWGDRFAIYGDCGEFLLSDGPHSSYWRPGAASQAILDGLAATQDEPLALPDAGTKPDQVVARWSDLVVARDPRADSLWDGQAPEVDATKLQLKVDGARDTTVTGSSSQAYEVDALVSVSTVGGCPVYRETTFRLGRSHPEDPWKILSWTANGPAHGC